MTVTDKALILAGGALDNQFLSIWDVETKLKIHVLHADFMSVRAALRPTSIEWRVYGPPSLPEHHLWTIETVAANSTSNIVICNYALSPIFLVFYAGPEYGYYRRSGTPATISSSSSSSLSSLGGSMINVGILGASPVGNGKLLRVLDLGLTNVPRAPNRMGVSGNGWGLGLHIPKCILVGRLAFVTSATGGDMEKILVVDVRTGKRLYALGYPGLGTITDLKVSGDGTKVVVAGISGAVLVWDVEGSGQDADSAAISNSETELTANRLRSISSSNGTMGIPGWRDRRSWIA
ncbi:hypothetical protein HK097_003044 [Rhizophlyctis rosea]|uniref:Uncharacterized protein n=1 Tax=Rhizophlyctis rosea TaxID=64517 RepID=A0AAD5SK72_9FUNG|nr:hypothetical protein HK097_003044 [Rhizophlyctis rosea]